jgi:DNA-binding SARP family transcriptional activator/tetratricopeptide (TPR) repeat protein
VERAEDISAPHTDVDEPVEFRVLGPVEVIRGATIIPVTAGRNESVLAVLLLEAGRVVSVQRLVDALWADDPPSTARSQLQICVSMLRKMLAGTGAVILTRPPGYLLRIPDEALDLWRFRRLRASADGLAGQQPGEAVARYREALALWRGEACASVTSQIVQHAAIRLNEERWAATESCLDLELRLGRHQQVAAELAELVAAQPLRERPRALLMLALYRCGRQAEALEVYRTGRQILIEEIGAEPGGELQAVEQAILAGDGRLRAPVEGVPVAAGPASAIPLPRQLPAIVPDFVGRDDLLKVGCKVLQQPTAGETGSVPVVLLTGRGGIGKTTLALGIAHALRDDYPDGQLFAKLRESGGPVTNPAGVLEQFLRSLGVPTPAIPERLAERTAMFRSCLADRKVLVVLDDAASVSQVEPLLPGDPRCGVIITSRTRLPGPPGAVQLEVGVLDPGAAAELLNRVVGADRMAIEPTAAAELIRLCEGLPLALRIVAAKLAARGHWPVRRMVERLADERRRLNELDLEGTSIRATLEFSYHNLPDGPRVLLDRLGLLNQADFPAWISAPLLAVSPAAAEDILEELVAAGLVEARITDDGSARYRMHDMIRLFAREKLTETHPAADRLAAVHRYLGCWLALIGTAHREFHGGDFHLVHGSAPQWSLPEDLVAELLAAPLDWFHRERCGLVEAILLAAQAKLDEFCWDLAVTTVTFFELGAYPDDWYQTHEAALAVTMEMGNDRGTAALLHSLGLRSTGRDLDEARGYLRQSLDIWQRLADPHGEALALVALANAARLAGALDEAGQGYEQALRRFEEAADPAGQASALRGIGQVAMQRGDHDLATTLLDRSISIARQAGARRDAAQSMYYSAELLYRLGEFGRAEERLREVASHTKRSGDLIGEGYALLALAIGRVQAGQFPAAASDLSRAGKLARESGDTLLRGRILLADAELKLAAGSPEQARSQLAAAEQAFAAVGSPPLWQAQCQELAARLGT